MISGVRSQAWGGLPDSATILSAAALSFISTLAVVCLAALLGTPLAYVLSRHEFRGKRLVSLFIELPIVMPPAVAGLALLLTFGRRGAIGSLLAEAGIIIPFFHHRGDNRAVLHFGAILHSVGASGLLQHRRRSRGRRPR